jgi:hypothetical protein
MVLEATVYLVLAVLAGSLGLRLVPDRWNRIDAKVGLSGLSLSAEADPDESE